MMSDAEELRWRFEKLMHICNRSVERDRNGDYYYQTTRDYWTCFQQGAFAAQKMREEKEKENTK